MKLLVENISKKYDDREILKNVGFSVDDNEILCIMGESGAGKTTLLRIIMGVEKCDEGKVSGNSNMSAVFQDNRLIGEISALSNIRLAINNKHHKNINGSILKELNKLFDEDNKIFYKPSKELSGGMARRVELVRAMLADSKLVVLDEPFAGLDDESKKKCINYIKDMSKHRKVIISTHNTEDVKSLGAGIYRLTR